MIVMSFLRLAFLGEIKVIFPLHTLLIEQHVVDIYSREREKREKEIEI